MGNARKQLFFGPQRFPSITCSICTSPEPDTWKHVLLHCRQRSLLTHSKVSRSFILTNAGTFQNNPPENMVPAWLLPCSCTLHRCMCYAQLRPDILCVRGLPYNSPPPANPHPHLTIQFVEFTYCNDQFSQDIVALKIAKYSPLIQKIQEHRWQVAPLITITAGA
jgi:hypothetical protein